MTPSPNYVTRAEVHAEVRNALKWVAGTGLALAFGLGAWATQIRADVTSTQRAIVRLDQGETAASVRLERQLDSLRIEMRHLSRQQDDIKDMLQEVTRAR